MLAGRRTDGECWQDVELVLCRVLAGRRTDVECWQEVRVLCSDHKFDSLNKHFRGCDNSPVGGAISQ